MFTDITGKKRLKVGLHTHTKLSDGRMPPEEAIALYAAAGYDALAITDHWKYAPAGEACGMKLISGIEYDIANGFEQTFHVVALGMEYDPEIPREYAKDRSISIYQRVKTVVAAIRDAGGIAVLAHPAWSLNTPEQIMAAGDFDALEIYNSVSECGMSDRPYSGLLVDMLAAQGIFYPLTATDDTHYYNGDEMRGITMLEADAVEELGFAGAIREKRFYATQGPEIHLERINEDQVMVRCTPAVKIAFLSNVPWTKGRMTRGENLTEAVYNIMHERGEGYIRAEVTDKNGLTAWSNTLIL